MANYRERLQIEPVRLAEINRFLLDPANRVVNDFLEAVARHGGVDEINRRAEEARQFPRLLARLAAEH